MKLLYLDLVGGIAGDMTVAALLELGVPLEHLREAVRAVGLEGVALETAREARHSIAGTRFTVRNTLDDAAPDTGHHHGHEDHQHPHDHGHGHGHGEAHSHEHPHHHGHDHDPPHPHAGGHAHPHRPYAEIRRMVEGSALDAPTRERALAVFARLAEAEGAVHGIPPEEVVFHEVGAWDAVADVVCAAAGIAWLAPDVVYCSRVPLGTGTVHVAHGAMPVPTPATLKLLAGFPVEQGGPAYERTTPTGAAILAALARPAPEPLHYRPLAVGIGLGSKDPPEVPNLLRAVLGEADDSAAAGIEPAHGAVAALDVETVECATANLDDTSPEWLGYLMERLFAAGALDVCLLPAQMKKNRPGTRVEALYAPERRAAVLDALFREATTLGVRYHTLQRAVLPREAVTVETPYGAIAGKVARYAGEARFSPEYEACRTAALQHNAPLQAVYAAAHAAWRERAG